MVGGGDGRVLGQTGQAVVMRCGASGDEPIAIAWLRNHLQPQSHRYASTLVTFCNFKSN